MASSSSKQLIAGSKDYLEKLLHEMGELTYLVQLKFALLDKLNATELSNGDYVFKNTDANPPFYLIKKDQLKTLYAAPEIPEIEKHNATDRLKLFQQQLEKDCANNENHLKNFLHPHYEEHKSDGKAAKLHEAMTYTNILCALSLYAKVTISRLATGDQFFVIPSEEAKKTSTRQYDHYILYSSQDFAQFHQTQSSEKCLLNAFIPFILASNPCTPDTAIDVQLTIVAQRVASSSSDLFSNDIVWIFLPQNGIERQFAADAAFFREVADSIKQLMTATKTKCLPDETVKKILFKKVNEHQKKARAALLKHPILSSLFMPPKKETLTEEKPVEKPCAAEAINEKRVLDALRGEYMVKEIYDGSYVLRQGTSALLLSLEAIQSTVDYFSKLDAATITNQTISEEIFPKLISNYSTFDADIDMRLTTELHSLGEKREGIWVLQAEKFRGAVASSILDSQKQKEWALNDDLFESIINALKFKPALPSSLIIKKIIFEEVSGEAAQKPVPILSIKPQRPKPKKPAKKPTHFEEKPTRSLNRM